MDKLSCFSLSIENHVAHLVLNRPEALNTMGPTFWKELDAVLKRLHSAGEARALVISSTGKHFSAGMSLDTFSSAIQMDDHSPEGRAAIFDSLTDIQATFTLLETLRIPVIAAIHGGCIGGAVDKPVSFTLADLQKDFESVEVTAVLQCSGNGRGFQVPRVMGGQSGNGAMGNARWKGVRLKDLLLKAGVKAGAKQVSFDGLDKPVAEKTPDFVKALELDQALDGEVLVAWEMNGEPLPFLNGFPLRLVVPGHYGTYWIKHLSEITVLTEPFTGFWNAVAYRIPDNGCGFIEPGTKAEKTTEIRRYKVRSFITSVLDGEQVSAKRPITLKGIAFDGGRGIREVQVSTDGGRSWTEATLGKDLGNYSFREWSLGGVKLAAGTHELKVRAFNRAGESQPLEAQWNPNGYLRNVVETTRVKAA